MQPFFSIITPVYKAERFIQNCIESVLSQTYQDFELILIDDGSPDKSGTICDEYANNDSRIKVIHKLNGGVSNARNQGLDIATGKYILFLDSDDYLSPEALMICKNVIDKCAIDILQFSIQGITVDGIQTYKNTSKRKTTNVMSSKDYINYGQMQVCAGGSCINKNIIDKNGIRFKQNIKLAEDQIFIISSIIHSRSIKFENVVLYYYLDNPTSATHINKSKDVINSITEIENFISINPISKGVLNKQILNFICILLKNDDININVISKTISERTFIYSSDLRVAEKLFCILSKINFNLSCYIIRLLYKFIK